MSVSGGVKRLLQAEGVAYFLIALGAYHVLNGSWIMFLILFFVPDLTFAAYFLGSRVGAYAYNAMHSTIGPLLMIAASYVFRHPELHWIGLIWLAHVGFDRMLGYGLKYETGFKDTHMGNL
jgi:hypothetical protein